MWLILSAIHFVNHFVDLSNPDGFKSVGPPKCTISESWDFNNFTLTGEVFAKVCKALKLVFHSIITYVKNLPHS